MPSLHTTPGVIYNKSKGERIYIDQILHKRIWNRQVCTCGPQRMINGFIAAAAEAGMTEDEVNYEVFTGADTIGNPFLAAVVGKDEDIRLDILRAENTLSKTMREAGLEMGRSSKFVDCGTCRVVVKCRKVEHRGIGLSNIKQQMEMSSYASRGIRRIETELPAL